MFKINYGETQLEIETPEKYNTGKPIKVQAVRQFKGTVENGILILKYE